MSAHLTPGATPLPALRRDEGSIGAGSRAPEHFQRLMRGPGFLQMTFPALKSSTLSDIIRTSHFEHVQSTLGFCVCTSVTAWPPPPLSSRAVSRVAGLPCLPIQPLRSPTWSMPGWLLLYSVRVSTCSGTSPWACRR